MMLRIEIIEEAATTGEMVDHLNQIATMVKEGYTSGYRPSWRLEGEEEPDEVD